jgi:hypothetical protein
MTSAATRHRAWTIGNGWWDVDFLPGRHFDHADALRAMRIAAAVHDRADTDPAQLDQLWTRSLGMTAREAIGYACMTDSAEMGIDR